MIDHPVFRRFAHYKDYSEDWLGARFAGGGVVGNERVPAWPEGPGLHEELFEWISMLQAVLWARERFVMLELGAGFGRWGIWSAIAAKAVGINDICVRLVEAKPQHSSWAAESIRLNGLERDVTLIEGAISNSLEPVPFLIDLPAENLQADSWWGQSSQPNKRADHAERRDLFRLSDLS